MHNTGSLKSAEIKQIVLIGSGWKALSMIDVYNSITFTLWLCGCNLKCPFCHNWRIAENDPQLCSVLDIQLLLDELESSKPFIDYLHITGGEPLIQHSGLTFLLQITRDSMGIKTSLNTNLTLYKPLEKLIKNELVDHLATDLKIPYNLLYGYREEIAERLWKLYNASLDLVTEYGIPLELRIPIAKNIPFNTYKKYLEAIMTKLLKHPNFYIIVQPLLGLPITDPRDIEWCEKYCNPDTMYLEEIKELLKDMGAENVILRKTLSMG